MLGSHVSVTASQRQAASAAASAARCAIFSARSVRLLFIKTLAAGGKKSGYRGHQVVSAPFLFLDWTYGLDWGKRSGNNKNLI